MKKSNTEVSLADMAQRIAALPAMVRELSTTAETIRLAIGAPLPTDRFDGLPKCLIPDVSLTDEQYMRRITGVLGKRNNLERMSAYESIVSQLADDLQSARSKLEKIDERLVLQDRDSPEYKAVANRKSAVKTTVIAIAMRMKLCASRWCECRRKVVSAIDGMTERFYSSMGDVTLGHSVRKFTLGERFDEILSMDRKEMKRGE